MELRLLRYFLAVAQEGSMTAAAEKLNLTQPTLSRQLKDLEQELGQRLFVRSSHNLRLTSEGQRLQQRAEEIIDLVHKTKAEFKKDCKHISGQIYIGSGETQAMSIIAEVMESLKVDYPDICYHLYSGNATDVTERLDKGLLDFGILIQPTNLSKYESLPLPYQDVWGVIMPQDSPLAQKSAINKNDLQGLPLICSRQILAKNPETNNFLRWFGVDFEKQKIIATYNLVFNAAILAQKGLGYVITLDKLVDSNIGKICFRPLTPSLTANLNIVWKKNHFFSPAAQIFLNALKQKLSKLTS